MRAAAALLLAFAAPALAQLVPPAADPGAIQQREIDREQREREEELRRRRIDRPLERPPAPSPPVPGDAEAVRFVVREIRFPPSEILAREELDALSRPLLGREASLAEIHALIEAVNALYRDKGVVTARAVLEPQEIAAGTVVVRLIEGRIGRYEVRGAQSTDAGYVTDRMSQPPGSLPQLERLEADLVRFNRSNDAQLRAELRPGERFGETDVVLQLAEPQKHSLRLSADNLGSRPTGEERIAATYRNASVFGRRDDLNLTLTGAEGHTGAYVTYSMPVNRLGGRVQGGYYDDRTRIVNGPLVPLRITGTSNASVLTLRQPTWVSATRQLDAVVSYKRRNTENLIDSHLLSSYKLADWSVGGELYLDDARGAWSVSAHHARGRNDVLGLSRIDYAAWRGAARRTERLRDDLAAVVAVGWQYSGDDLLPSSEQFVIGGEGSVRGYDVGTYAGDRGIQASAELHRGFGDRGGVRTSGFGFLDYGEVWPFRAPNAVRGSDKLAGAGAGMQLSSGRSTSGRVTLALPLRSVPDQKRGAARLTFQAAVVF